MVLPISHPHQRYSISGYQEEELPDGEVRWSCDLLRYGQSFGLVGNQGSGAQNDYSFTDTARGEEFCSAAAELHPAAEHPEDVLVDELVMIRSLNALDQVAYCLAEDRFEEFGEHRLAEPGMTFAQVRRELATKYAGRNPRIWDKGSSSMVPVPPGDTP